MPARAISDSRAPGAPTPPRSRWGQSQALRSTGQPRQASEEKRRTFPNSTRQMVPAFAPAEEARDEGSF